MFASIIAPFGGFFASGFKRGFKIKDFGDSIPGHGGMTDRMDCQAQALSRASSAQDNALDHVLTCTLPVNRLSLSESACACLMC